MIGGMVMLEDTALHFRAMAGDGGNRVLYTVCDTLTGNEATLEVSGEDFMVALGIAMSYDGGCDASKEAWRAAERVQPEDKNLRWIP